MKKQRYLELVGMEGTFPVLAPLPFLLWSHVAGGPVSVSFFCAVAASLAALLSAVTLLRHAFWGKLFIAIAAVCLCGTFHPTLRHSPFWALAALIVLISTLFFLFDFNLSPVRGRGKIKSVETAARRAKGALFAVLPVLACKLLLEGVWIRFGVLMVVLSWLIALGFYLRWALVAGKRRHLLWGLCALLLSVLFLFDGLGGPVCITILICSLAGIVSFPADAGPLERRLSWWDVLLAHPAWVLALTFLVLCIIGTMLLLLPAATSNGIRPLDSAFTSVSAVCVTGLAVLDTAKDFTFFGQALILLLIQLGGLGIMSITTVAMHVMGYRMSLRQERLVSSIGNDSEESEKNLVITLKTILIFTFCIEGIGALLLTLLFLQGGDGFAQALWRGIFTSISAFCNAGFSLQSDSLVAYKNSALILHVVALLIIAGGIAPATALAIPAWLRGRKIPLTAHISLLATVCLLVSGWVLFLVFEWSGILSGLSLWDKLQNAWFQSATLRTAGFNSVGLETMAAPTLLFSLFYMFIGGSPGGTAGGVKTSTIGLLALTFRAGLTGQDAVVFRRRRIPFVNVQRAVTVMMSGAVIWLAIVFMLLVTQHISARELIFEATSAIATVGLTIGATPKLDEIGKIIIILAMFIGRIGPMTMFLLLSGESSSASVRYPEEKITLS